MRRGRKGQFMNKPLITDRLLTDINYHKMHGLSPSLIYLGGEEYSELIYLARQFISILDRTSGPLKRNGFEVYEINAKNHYGFDTQAPSPCG
jgi:hypothetical protein